MELWIQSALKKTSVTMIINQASFTTVPIGKYEGLMDLEIDNIYLYFEAIFKAGFHITTNH